MFELQIFLQRRRKMLTRLSALVVIGLGTMLAILPRADAHAMVVVPDNPKMLLLSPERLSAEGFSAFYVPAHR